MVVIQPIPLQAGRDGLQLQSEFTLEQESLDQLLVPRQLQVADHPHDPGLLAELSPVVQVKNEELSHKPFTTTAEGIMNDVSHFHCTISDLPMIRSSITDCSNPSYHAVIRIALILVVTAISGEDI